MADDLVNEFLAESNENLDTLDRELVLLEKDPKNSNILGSVFRSIHTIKGTCGFLGFTKLEKVAHVGENLLSSMRDGKLTLNTDIASGLMSMVDAVRRMLTAVAFKASRLVCWAIEVMTLMTCPTFALDSPNFVTVALVCVAAFSASPATFAASLAFLAISLMLALISSVAVATVCKLRLTSSVAEPGGPK